MENEKKVDLIIIEDNALFASALKQYLITNFEKMSIRANIQTFKNSETFLDWIAHFSSMNPDIIIMDYFLDSQYSESMNGVKAMAKVKILKPGTEVIFLSSEDQLEISFEALRMGAFDYIFKNEHSFSSVFQSIKNCLDEKVFAVKNNPKKSQSDNLLN